MTTRYSAADGEQRAMDYLHSAETRLRDASNDGDRNATNALAHVSETLQARGRNRPLPARNGESRHS